MNGFRANPAARGMISLAIASCAVVALQLGPSARAGAAGTFELDACAPYTLGSGVFVPHTSRGTTFIDTCASGFNALTDGLMVGTAGGVVPAGTRASWGTTAPAGFSIVAVVIPRVTAYGVNDGTGWGGGFFFGGSGKGVTPSTASFGTFMHSSYFGWQIVCGWKTCNTNNNPAFIAIPQVKLFVEEITGPSVIAKAPLYYQNGWIRGTWPLAFTTADVSGVCNIQTRVDGQVMQGPISARNNTAWQQCGLGGMITAVNTADHPNGAMSLALVATNAAGVSSPPARTLHADNSPVGLSIGGPGQSTWIGRGTTLTARATAGPSGVSGINCIQTGGIAHWTAGATRQVPINGTGVHTLTCNAGNNARDATGHVASSARVSRVVRIDDATGRRV